MRSPRAAAITIQPLTPARWPDLKELFGERGACGGCWCMWWRLKRRKFEKQKGAGNKRALHRMVRQGKVPGLLAYTDGKPVGWCAVEPRESYVVLENSRVLARVDEQVVWSVVCLFVARPYRRRGVTTQLVRAAVQHARKHGARIVEGYPVAPRGGKTADAFAWTGLPSSFLKAGFVEVARRSPTRPIMRHAVAGEKKGRKRR